MFVQFFREIHFSLLQNSTINLVVYKNGQNLEYFKQNYSIYNINNEYQM